jgi:hypothetical protein
MQAIGATNESPSDAAALRVSAAANYRKYLFVGRRNLPKRILLNQSFVGTDAAGFYKRRWLTRR